MTFLNRTAFFLKSQASKMLASKHEHSMPEYKMIRAESLIICANAKATQTFDAPNY